MSNNDVDRKRAKDAILDILRDLPGWGGPQLQAVVGFEPFDIPVSPVGACWYEGEASLPEGRMTLANRMVGRRYMVQLYWHAVTDGDQREQIEVDIENAERAVQKGLWEDATLDDAVTYLDCPELTEVGYVSIGNTICRALAVPVILAELEGEEINR